MELTPMTFLIICPLLFLAGMVDAIGGGGGLISLPAYLIAGVPAHAAIATNKLSSCCGTSLATWRFIRAGLVNFRLAVPAVIAAIIGSSIGANLSLMVPEKIMIYILTGILPIAVFLVLNKKLFNDSGTDKITLDKRTYLTASISAFIIGMYDGFYGPGTGTFLLLVLTGAARYTMKEAAGTTKAINLSSNVAAFVTFVIHGKIIYTLGLAAAICSILGNYIGSGLVMGNGQKIVRPLILVVLAILFVKILSGN